MARDGTDIVEQARQYLSALHTSTGADVQQDIANAKAQYENKKVIEALEAAQPKAKTAVDMQKKKEDRIEEKNQVDSLQIKKDRAQKALDDFDNNKEIDWTDTNQRKAYDAERKRLQEAVDTAGSELAQRENQRVRDGDMAEINAMPDEDREQLRQYIENRDINNEVIGRDNLILSLVRGINLDKSKDVLTKKYGADKVDQLASTYSRYLKEEQAEQVETDTRAAVQENPWAQQIPGTINRLLGGPQAAADRFAEMFSRDDRYSTLAPYVAGDLISLRGNTVTSETANIISGDKYDGNGQTVYDGGILRQGAAYLYQGGMTMVDSFLRAAAGGGATGSAALAACNAFSQTVSQASQQGATPEQAYTLGAAVAGIEYLSEKIPLDNLLDTAKGGKQTLMQAIGTALKQAGIEATTEEISLLGTVLAEAAILKENSSYQRSITAKILSGIAPEQAKMEALREILEEAKNTALVSMVSGAGSSTVSTVAANNQLFAQEQAMNNPALNKPGKKDTAQATESPAQTTQAQPVTATETVTQTTTAKPAMAAQTAQEAQTAQPQQTEIQQQSQKKLEVSDIVAAITGKARDTGTVSNKDATQILSDPQAVATLEQESGRTIEGSNSEKRAIVKEIVKNLSQQNTAQEVAQQPQTEAVDNVQTVEAPQAQQEVQGQNVTQEAQQVRVQGGDTQVEAENVSAAGLQQQIKGTGAAEQNFTGTAAYDNLLTDDNVQRERKGDVRSVEVPITDAEGRKVSEAAGNIMNSEWTPDAVTDTIKKMVMEGRASHDVMSNEAALKNAANAIKNEGGAYNSLQAIKEQASKGWTSPEAVAKAELIYHHFANEVAKMEESGGADETTKNLASDAFVTLAQLATNSGQSTQLFSVFRRMTPELQVKTLEKNVQRYVDEINKERRTGKRAAVNAEAQKAQKPVSDAVKKARKETGSAATKAADKIRFKGNKVKIDADKYSEPFVFEYAQKVGEALAKGLENSQKKKPAKTFLQTMTSELRKFAAEKMPAAQKERQITPTELLRDYIQNQDFYAEAWSAAQETIREKHANDPAYLEFISSGIGVDANANPQNRIMAKALAAAAMETGETNEMLRKQQALGITGMSENIANKLIRDTGATGEMAQTIRDAAYEFVKNRINEGDGKKNAKTYDANYFVNEAMRDIKQSMADVAKRNTQGRETVKQTVIDSLTRKYNIGLTDAKNIAEVVGDTFDQKAQEQARKILEQKFGEREKKKPKSAGQMIEEYANLGAYGNEPQYSEQATESFLRAAMRDIGVTVSELAKSGKDNKEAVQTKISQMITERHGINKADADHIAEVVGDQLAAMTQEKAKKILEQRFADRPKSEKKTAMQMLSEYANLGAFDVGSEFNERATSKIVGDKYSTTLREDLVQNFLNAKTDDAKTKAMDEIYKDVASRIAPTLEESWDAWRNLAMMFNAKTHERNFLSTGAFKPYTIIKRNVAAVIESAFVDKQNRTRGMLGIGKKSVDLLKWAKADANSTKVTEAFGNYGKGGNEAARKIQEYRQMMWKPLDKLGKFNMNLMEKEDLVWKRNEYAASLASFLKSRGYTAEQAAKGQIPDAVMNEARQLAINDAAKATFTDRNRFSDAIAKFRVKGDDPVSKSINALAKGVLPYARTPANIVVRVKEYTPIEIARGFHTLATKVKSGEATVTQGIDQIASGLTGTGMMILGAALRDGLIPGVKLIGRAEEEEKREGAQDYSVKIGDQYYGIGFLAPACIPLFIGAELGKAFPSWSDFWESSAFDKADALSTIGAATLDPMLELSVMSSLNNIVDTYNSAETSGEGVIAAMITAATSYFTQGLPTIIGQAEQATETVKTSAYVNTDNPTEKTIKSIVSNATQRIPGVDLYRTTKLDEWGQPVTNEGSQDKRINNALFNPFTVTKAKTDDLTKEISRLNKSQEENVAPSYIPKVISYTDKDGNKHNNHRMTEEEYQTLAQTQGQTAKSILESMIKSKNYAAMTDDQRAKAMQQVYTYAREKAMQKAFPDHLGYSESWMQELREGKEADYILRRVTNSELNRTMSNLTTAWDNKYSTGVTDSYSRELETAYNSYAEMDKNQKALVRSFATGTAAKYIEAREKGISHADFLKTAKAIKSIKPEAGSKEPNQKQQLETIARAGLSESQKVIMAKLYATDAQDKNIDEVNTLTQKLRQEGKKVPQGSAFDLYTQLYRDHSDYTTGIGKKNRTINHWTQKYGIDYSTAKKYYEVFS